MSMDGQGTRWRRKIAENFNRVSRVHQRHRQTTDRETDRRAIAYSEREREFTFAKNRSVFGKVRGKNRPTVAPFSGHGV